MLYVRSQAIHPDLAFLLSGSSSSSTPFDPNGRRVRPAARIFLTLL